MNKEGEIIFYKSTALNEIRKLFNPLHKFKGDLYSSDSFIEQKGRQVEYIIENLECHIKRIKNKYKEK